MESIAQQLNIREFPLEIFDKNGNRIYFENSMGFWDKTEYGSQGKQVHCENSRGFWSKREYDCKGNMIYFENSDGFLEKREYDSQGNMIYFENSDGEVIDNRKIPEYTMEELVEKLGNFKLKK